MGYHRYWIVPCFALDCSTWICLLLKVLIFCVIQVYQAYGEPMISWYLTAFGQWASIKFYGARLNASSVFSDSFLLQLLSRLTWILFCWHEYYKWSLHNTLITTVSVSKAGECRTRIEAAWHWWMVEFSYNLWYMLCIDGWFISLAHGCIITYSAPGTSWLPVLATSPFPSDLHQCSQSWIYSNQ